MELKTTMGKGRDGWKAETTIELDAPYILRISTYKSSRGLVTNATRYKAERGMISFEMFGDFNQTVILSGARCTEKSVATQHAAALADVEGIKAKCAAYYAGKAAAKAA